MPASERSSWFENPRAVRGTMRLPSPRESLDMMAGVRRRVLDHLPHVDLDNGGRLLERGFVWTSSTFSPWPGYETFPYPKYSEVFFGPGYRVLRGGSWATRPGAIRNTFRNWDYPVRRQIFSGFRCASDD